MAAQLDKQPQAGGNPTSSWTPGETVVDTIPMQVTPSAAPGTYQLNFGLYDAATGVRARSPARTTGPQRVTT